MEMGACKPTYASSFFNLNISKCVHGWFEPCQLLISHGGPSLELFSILFPLGHSKKTLDPHVVGKQRIDMKWEVWKQNL
jgi:hypothetical protein